MTTPDRYNLRRFTLAQDARGTYRQAIAEVRAGKKTSHWIWFIMPRTLQRLAGVNYSPMSEYYALASRWEARAYLKHPVLGRRLMRCVEAILAVRHRTLLEIFGPVDALKVRECAALFASLNVDPIFITLQSKP